MKCLRGGKVFDDQSLPKEHYATFHNADENNYIFKKLFYKGWCFCAK